MEITGNISENEKINLITDPAKLNPYIDYCSQLYCNHMNNTVADERKIPTSILAVDIKRDPKTFILNMCSVVTHMVIESTCLKNNKFLAPFDPQA